MWSGVRNTRCVSSWITRTLAVVGLLLSFGSSNSSAQDPADDPLVLMNAMPRLYVGIVGGYNRAYHSPGFQSIGRVVYLPYFADGVASGYYFGISAEYLLRRPGGFRSSILAHAVYTSMPAQYHMDGPRLPAIDQHQNVVYSKVRYAAEVEYSLIDLDLLLKLDLFGWGLGVTVGPVIGVPVSVNRVQRMELVNPSDSKFDPSLFSPEKVEYVDGGKAIIASRDDIPDRTGVRMAFKAGVQYDIPFGSMLVVPSVSYNFGLTEVGPSANFRVNALQVGMDLRFAL